MGSNRVNLCNERSRYSALNGSETFFDEVDSAFSGTNKGGTSTESDGAAGMGTTGPQSGTNPAVLNPVGSATSTAYNVGQGMNTDTAEKLNTGDQAFNQMAFSIEKVTVTAKSRALKAEYSLELAQDLKAIHGLNAEAELANILSTEILAEINREVIRTIYKVAEQGAVQNVAQAGCIRLRYRLKPVDGQLRSSKDFYSKSREMRTQSHKELVARKG